MSKSMRIDHCDRCDSELSDVWGDTGTLFHDQLLCDKCLEYVQSDKYEYDMKDQAGERNYEQKAGK
jgi:hypothetical protein